MEYGFVGLGNLGVRLAHQLLASNFTVRVHDLNKDAAQELLEKGAQWADSPSAAATGVDGLITCLPCPEASTEVLLGKQGALAHMKPGSTWFEMSTSDVSEIKRIAELAAEHGVEVLECPVTGGLHRAARGEMTVFVGGRKEVFECHRPALEAICGHIFYVGEISSASLLKVITNMLCLIDLVAAGEALMLAKQGGLDLGTCYRAICESSGTSREFEDWAPVILNGSLNTGFTLDLALKDLGFGLDYGRELNVPLQLTELVEHLMQEARNAFGGDAWTPHVIKMMETAAGTELRADGFPDVIEQANTIKQ